MVLGQSIQDDGESSLALVALGKNWRKRPLRLSIESEMIAIASGHLLSQGVSSLLIISGGMTAGSQHPSESAAMRAYLLRRSRPGRQSDCSIAIEEASIDTAGNAENVRTMVAEYGIGGIGLVSTRSHLPAAASIFRAHGMEVAHIFAAEDVLLSRSHHYEPLIRRFRRSPHYAIVLLAEWGRRLLLRVDRRGIALRPITRLLRGGA